MTSLRCVNRGGFPPSGFTTYSLKHIITYAGGNALVTPRRTQNPFIYEELQRVVWLRCTTGAVDSARPDVAMSGGVGFTESRGGKAIGGSRLARPDLAVYGGGDLMESRGGYAIGFQSR